MPHLMRLKEMVVSVGEYLSPYVAELRLYIPALISIYVQTAILAVSAAVEKICPFTRSFSYGWYDLMAADIRHLSVLISRNILIDHITTWQYAYLNLPSTRDLYILCDGAVSETAVGVQLDETTAARNATANDMNLPPMSPANGDKYYIGSDYPFRGVWFNLGIPGAGNWTIVWYYWNGSGWTATPYEDDQTSQFQRSGMCSTHWAFPTSPAWVKSTIMGKNLYWAKVEILFYYNQTTKPLGNQAWVVIV